MEQKSSTTIKFYKFIFFQVLILLFASKIAMGQKTPISIKVGVVLDMDHYIGRMGLECIKMALSNFYAEHENYNTRLHLTHRHSKNDVIGAAAAAVDLLKNVQVQAILGPLFSTQTSFLIALGDNAQVPIVTFSATSPSLLSIRSPYFVRAALDDSLQVQAIAAIIQAYKWRQVVLVYEDNTFGKGVIPFLTDALEQVNARVPYRSVLPSPATDDQIDAELYELMTRQTRVFVVHLSSSLGSRLFIKAKQLGMMNEDYIWIITDGMTNELSSMDSLAVDSMLGVVGVKPHVPKTKALHEFTNKYKMKNQENNPNVLSPNLNIFGLWAYDSVFALAMAAEEAILASPTFRDGNISRNSSELETIGISNIGPALIRHLLNSTHRGIAGEFKLVNGQLQSPPYEVVNVVGPGARVIGYWTKGNGIVRDLNFTSTKTSVNSTSKSNFRSIIWPGDRTFPGKGWVIPINGKKLRIGVPVKDGFKEFVKVTWNPDNTTSVKGYCIDVFDKVIERLPYGLPYEYVPFATADHKMAGDYNDLVQEVLRGGFDAVVGDVTIVADRSQYVDFTLPYMESGVKMIVPYKDDKIKNAWVFVKPLTLELWLASFCSFVFIGCLIWILEHQINEDFRGPPWYQVGVVLWFAFSTMVFAQKERVTSNLARFVMIIWFLVVLILTQSYTASLTSMLTVQQLKPTVTDVNVLIKNKEYIGYKKGSFVHGLLKRMNIEESTLIAYSTEEHMNELFQKGSQNGGISAAFHEIAYIKLFLVKYCSRYTMVGPTYKTDGFGFVFPMGSPLVSDVSRAILNVTEGNTLTEIEREWFGDVTTCTQSDPSVSPEESLRLASFWGLFMIVGIAGILALVIHVILFLVQNRQVLQRSDPESTIWSKLVKLLHLFDNRDMKSQAFKMRDTDCLEVVVTHSGPENYQQSPVSLSSPGQSPIYSSSEHSEHEGDQESSRGNEISSPQLEPRSISGDTVED